MKKSVVIFITAVCLLITGCGDTGSLSKLPSSSFHEDKQKLTIMHIDADNKRFQDFIEETEKKLDMEITTLFFKHFTSVFYLGHLSSFDINGANGACGCV